MAVFAAIASLLLGQISRSRKDQQALLQQEEVLRVARMALQTGQEELHINGIAVRQLKTDKQLLVYHEGGGGYPCPKTLKSKPLLSWRL